LAQHGVMNALFGAGATRSAAPSFEEVGGMAGQLGPIPKALRNFRLPNGRVTALDTQGVNRVLEDVPALKQLKRLTEPSLSQIHAESGYAPAVSSAHELADVAVPLADSLDTAATPKMPLAQARLDPDYQDPLKKKNTTVNRVDVIKIRELADQGMPSREIHELHFNHIPRNTVRSIAAREAFVKVK
jgi:hypothetical protein